MLLYLMNWDYILNEVLGFYLKLAFIFAVYYFTKFYVAQNRGNPTPSRWEKAWRYTAIVLIAGVIGCLSSVDSEDSDTHHTSTVRAERHSNSRGVAVFLIVLFPGLFGVALSAEERLIVRTAPTNETRITRPRNA